MHDKKGFTLIELLVVISIIALLVAILMPALNIARQQATGAVCLSNQKTLGLSWVMYADENEGRIVGGHVDFDTNKWRWYGWVQPPITTDPGLSPGQQEQLGIKNGLLFRHINSYDVYHCPGDKRDVRTRFGFRSYGISGTLNGEQSYKNHPTFGTHPYNPYSVFMINELKTPADKVVFMEETDSRNYNMGSWIMSMAAYQWIDPVAVWHNKKSTIAYADGHAEMHDWVEKSTMDNAASMFFNRVNTGSKDWEYMFRGYFHKGAKAPF